MVYSRTVIILTTDPKDNSAYDVFNTAVTALEAKCNGWRHAKCHSTIGQEILCRALVRWFLENPIGRPPYSLLHVSFDHLLSGVSDLLRH